MLIIYVYVSLSLPRSLSVSLSLFDPSLGPFPHCISGCVVIVLRVESCAAPRLFVALINEVVLRPSPAPTKTRVNRRAPVRSGSGSSSFSIAISIAISSSVSSSGSACLVWIYVKLSARPLARDTTEAERERERGERKAGVQVEGSLRCRRRFKLFNQIEFKWFSVFQPRPSHTHNLCN